MRREEAGKINHHAYTTIAKEFHEQSKDLTMKWQQELFLDMLSPNAHILDAMCGAGRDMKYFLSKGYQVSGFDFSQPLCDIAQQEAADATITQEDILSLDLQQTYDGIWCSAGIFMLEKKNVPHALERLAAHLPEKGKLYINYKRGEGEGSSLDKRYGVDRYQSFFKPTEFRKYLEPYFDVVKEMTDWGQNVSYRTHAFEDLFCVKK